MRRGRKRFLAVFGCFAVLATLGGLRASAWLRAHGLTAMEFATELSRDEPRFQWKSIDRKHWQAIATGAEETTAETDAREGTGRGCPAGMVRVRGGFRQEARGQSTGAIERLQDGTCTDWISKEFPARCRTFDAEKIATAVAAIPVEPLDFCMDRFEYPNVRGQYPMIVATFREAEAICKKDDKRLCTENEWTFACEGEEVRPYPYGHTRDDTACVIDRPWRAFTEGALQPRDGNKARDELDHLWQGEPSGSRPTCRSPFGVYDMTGNVDEWTRSVNPTGYRSILKGGYWGPVRARCRPATRAHNEDFVAYQQGVRCCAETRAVPDEPEAGAEADAGADPDAGAEPDAAVAQLAAPPDEPPAPDDDELVAIQNERARGCATAGGAGSWWPLLAILVVLVRRRRRSSRVLPATFER
ncbi:MAG: SUMF1/EgtB/PvdO family nonheme iron enzyme [Labilithrix sp.]|nr:SUMF1/EgtB/PvdO family nonheme iron enzyme [Labilithrix sp.]MCW5809732.1 SUMF1/EgtB/PvdO family nonheme iron enzyme [Labilithrix sp.]